MEGKVRIRDKIFPEGGRIRHLLRNCNRIVHECFSINFWKTQYQNIKKMGIKNAFIQWKKDISYGIGMDQNVFYSKWIKNNEPNLKELEEQKGYQFEKQPKISLIVPMYNTPINFFEELVEALISQTYENWELCLADGSEKKNLDLNKIIEKDKRIKYNFIGENKGIAGNTNEALKMATGEYVGLLDHDDLLPKFSLFEIIKCINENPNVEFIYTDEDKISEKNGKRFDAYFKSDFGPDTLRANNFICHFSIFKKELMDKLGGFNDEFNGAQDYDIILRMSEITTNIIHIPKVLYHWRVHQKSTAKAGDTSKPYAYEAGKKAIQSHINRLKLSGTVEDGKTLGTYRVKYDIIGNPKVSIIIPNKDYIETLDKCITKINEITTYNNYEIIIVENNSEKEETFEYYKKLSKEKNIKVVYYPEKRI